MKSIDKFTQISTKRGDKGTSKNYSNETFYKHDLLFDVLGTMDEASSMLGLAYHYSRYQSFLQDVQRKLQDINSLIATSDDEKRMQLTQIDDVDIEFLEEFEQGLLQEKPIPPKFVLPGSDTSLEGAYIDLARAIVRRAERRLVEYRAFHKRDDLENCIRYINRLSDVLFVVARRVS